MCLIQIAIHTVIGRTWKNELIHNLKSLHTSKYRLEDDSIVMSMRNG